MLFNDVTFTGKCNNLFTRNTESQNLKSLFDEMIDFIFFLNYFRRNHKIKMQSVVFEYRKSLFLIANISFLR